MRKKFIYVLWGLLILTVAAIAIIFSAIANGKIGYVPPVEELENPNLKFATQIISDDGQLLGTWSLSKENRVYVGYEDLSPNLVKALIATEDVRFKDHSGIDIRAFSRAVVKRGILMQKHAGGGSTITQQLAKQFYSPTADNVMERLLQKPIEWVIAVKLERYYTKEEILTMYLNKFDFLNNAVGIKTAAKTYFGKDPKDLSVEEAATLIGMCKNPSLYNPRRFNERCRGRRNVVLDQMRKADYLTEAECDSLKALPLTLKFQPVDHKDGLATYFREYLRGIMTAKKPNKSNYRGWQAQQYYEDSIAWETNPLYGWCNKNTKKDGSHYNVYTDGLKIYTTINSRMQRYAEEAVYEHVAQYLQPRFFKEKKGRKTAPYTNQLSEEEVQKILDRSIHQSDRYRTMKEAGYSESEIMQAFNTKHEMQVFSYEGEKDTIMTPLDSIKYYKHFLRAGFMSMDPITGYVKAYVGGPNYNYFQYDMAMVGRRQVGSTIKPYLYTLAMENGFSPCDMTRNVEQTLYDENGKAWSPRNSSRSHYGEMVTLKWGLANSNNWISAYLMSKLSPYELKRLIHSFGVLNKDIQPTVSLCLGPCEISVGEMVSAYTAFANRGIRTAPLFVTRIEDNEGNVVATFTPKMDEVISESSAYKMVVMLRAVINEGTGNRVRRLYGITADMGGKTGTTNRNSDGWFMGFTPSLVSGCWVGGEERDIHFDTMRDGQGASMALPVWGLYMQKVYADKTLGYSQDERFDIPDDFDPCKDKLTEIEEQNTGRLDDDFFQ
ncbi:transglycosylase domain-containing protein [Phocaeicola barnesiae]|jgi:penicillin-binding protein 1A|uniref:Transglycosylase domain-containing protein n=1 Tax=Phocaeicola barnesiae TaxID=376804 RepID=A0AAW5N6X4_9BACT|nr:transglycosylase domain-containing protein [Phocaeicola barnesiae]MCR8873623.1 transglycosylase domain-containing protein [Phocaeicola barnesiae]MDM8250821.1 transglycosylase domain-containing protein [Phocaeicola barnesiae]HJG77036.1 transglycosylase domain-containing protein [Phocaeicola barnesiae]